MPSKTWDYLKRRLRKTASTQKDEPEPEPEPKPTKCYPLDYLFRVELVSDPAKDSRETAEWRAVADFRCHSLLKVMQLGLYWSEANLVPGSSVFGPRVASSLYVQCRPYSRTWELREYFYWPESQCRWAGKIYLEAKSVNILGSLRLQSLTTQNVLVATAWNLKDSRVVFGYADPNCNLDRNEYPDINCLDDTRHPSQGSWWVWPRRQVNTKLDGRKAEATVAGCVDKPENKSSA
ncbi:hypothetical protein B0T25DRAFT_581918 [Lasiosphaeria hispida]|uniref:Uncharacterized protein n=1 Tax=Lasiosphaeria hispida TaxID=260671 RepID=A0AAJ0HDX5_9PEZI|nr:hypothetical protein B0T25DRAFT_581918 [Lasiosphaeria hispida]